MSLPIVLVHGIRLSGRMWAPQIRLIGPEHPVAAPDLPGHGSRRAEPFTLDAATDSVAAAIDRLGGRALVAGLSLGGYVAIATAKRYPDRVAGLLAAGCSARITPARMRPYRLVAGLLARSGDGGERIQRWAFERLFRADVVAAITDGGFSPDVVPDVLEALGGFDPISALRRYAGPVWIVNGSRDRFRTDEREFLAACREGRLLVLPRVGHLASFAQPEAFSRLVLDVAAAVERRSSPKSLPA